MTSDEADDPSDESLPSSGEAIDALINALASGRARPSQVMADAKDYIERHRQRQVDAQAAVASISRADAALAAGGRIIVDPYARQLCPWGADGRLTVDEAVDFARALVAVGATLIDPESSTW